MVIDGSVAPLVGDLLDVSGNTQSENVGAAPGTIPERRAGRGVDHHQDPRGQPGWISACYFVQVKR